MEALRPCATYVTMKEGVSARQAINGFVLIFRGWMLRAGKGSIEFLFNRIDLSCDSCQMIGRKYFIWVLGPEKITKRREAKKATEVLQRE
jgi:hypothetical protein